MKDLAALMGLKVVVDPSTALGTRDNYIAMLDSPERLRAVQAAGSFTSSALEAVSESYRKCFAWESAVTENGSASADAKEQSV